MKKRVTISIIIIVVLVWVLVCFNRQRRTDIVYGSDIYPGMVFLSLGWRGMGDSLTTYPQDSILYYGLDIDGKSIEEVMEKYGKYTILEYDTLHNGIGYGGWPEIYPISKSIPVMPIMQGWWDIPGDSTADIKLTVYFETDGNKSKAIYGYQFDYAQTRWMP
ncbi:hypothetical protein [uncultured Muribaculum sp.]|uniref:hypothetical protein n=1 Tax=uncultured Muribaculum sp. TaxID=1918613 RepID=UPI0025DC78D6|nr:hypothetical protein [uncultured Muribaculum sp.]